MTAYFSTPSLLRNATPRAGNCGDFGVRKYDDGIGRFTSIDPLFEKYPGWTPYQYSMNNPVNMKDDNGREVSVYSETIPLKTLATGAGGGLTGWSQAIFAKTYANPRHSFIMVTTDKGSTLIELGGPKNGSLFGSPKIDDTRRSNTDYGKDRENVKEYKVTEPKDQKSNYEFEEKVIENSKSAFNNLPVYNAVDGPNSNSFVKFVIDISGGRVDLDTWKAEATQGYRITHPTAPNKGESYVKPPCEMK